MAASAVTQSNSTTIGAAAAPEGCIVRTASVDGSRTPREVIRATRRRIKLHDSAVKTMPRGDGRERAVWFLPLEQSLDNDELAALLDSRSLIAADPYSVAAVNEADPSFADEYRNGTQWKYDGGWCYMSFRDGVIFVEWDRSKWPAGYWIACFPKEV